jgi:hypothetical protein
MRRPNLLLAALFSLAIVSPLSAQPGRGGAPAMPPYDPATEITLTGSVSEVTFPESPMGWKGVHLKLTAGDSVRSVHLGPAAYLEDQGFSFAADDRIQVTGSQVKCQGEDALLAREVVIGERRLILRDETGRPRWARRGGS